MNTAQPALTAHETRAKLERLNLHIVLMALAEAAKGEPLDPELCETIESIAKVSACTDFGANEVQALYDCGHGQDWEKRAAAKGYILMKRKDGEIYLDLLANVPSDIWEKICTRHFTEEEIDAMTTPIIKVLEKLKAGLEAADRTAKADPLAGTPDGLVG